ncbi:polynucleotide kinase-phosphatase [Nocardiopsis ansamitocini]|uniref:Polynucleotide kinase-phosphatase n=1 Tax=Nocardiopsis ansamitocini TaxID=1670832 RepID=A0A9W6P9B0_9ACTN|nr:polynucleotide kinase-phosphatase [Nocardiopsis ansamitocini]GLU49356.1 polynucleotide kinase-phosphatase [Nocardiopsis ansamitocini]
MSSERVLTVPQSGLVLLVGVPGAGKTTFAARNFLPSQIVGLDFCRVAVGDDPTDPTADGDALDLLHHMVRLRLGRGLLTVVDAGNVQERARRQLARIAKDNDVPCTAIVLDVPESPARQRVRERHGPAADTRDVALQYRELHRGLGRMQRQGIGRVHVLHGPPEVDTAVIAYERSTDDRRDRTGPFDIIGDVHGCRSELEALLTELGYALHRDRLGRAVDATHPERTVLFVGDLVDRGPDSPGVLRLVMGMVASGHALCVSGNHENKLVRALKGGAVRPSHGLAETLEQLDAESEEFRARVLAFCAGLVDHYRLDGGRLVVAHAGLAERYHGRTSGRVRSFALYGETIGATDEYGLPVRHPWANDYRGRATVVYGHVPTPEPEWVNNTICLDTGCVFGGRLTALRYPERALVAVPAERIWYRPARPFPSPHAGPGAPALRAVGAVDAGDVFMDGDRLGGKVETAHGTVRVGPEQAAAALEMMSRFAVDPRWLLYLPPAIAPVPTSGDPALLERPEEAFTHYLDNGVHRVVCQEKHAGTRAVVVVCRDEGAAARRFVPEALGAVYTRTGRPFFADPEVEAEVLTALREAVGAAGLWEDLDTDWVALDGELLPWSLGKEDLIRDRYATVGAAARAALPEAARVLAAAAERGLDVAGLARRVEERATRIEAFSRVYRRDSRPTRGPAGVRYAPFALLAAEGASFAGRDPLWHMGLAERLAEAGPLVLATRYLVVATADPGEVTAAATWWRDLVDAGGAGMVVKPSPGAPIRGSAGPVQPGLKVRSPEHLRIAYGPDYDVPGQLAVLRNRRLARVSAMALSQHALGLEALARHARQEPLRRVHQPVFGVLALGAEPVDPRL